MNYLKIVRKVAGLMCVAGLFLAFGTVGTCDYLDEIGQEWSIMQMFPRIMVGLLMMLPFIVTQDLEKEDDKDYFERKENNENGEM